MSDVLPFPERVTLDIKKLAQWLADARDLGFSEGMMEANASDNQRMPIRLTPTDTSAMLGASKEIFLCFK